jgi:hypothetical protein
MCVALPQVKAGMLLESELTNGERLSEAVYELSSIAPRVLTQVKVPARRPSVNTS